MFINILPVRLSPWGVMQNGAEVMSGLIPEDFKRVVRERAEKENKTEWDALLYLAVNGAEHLRLCRKEDHKRVGA